MRDPLAPIPSPMASPTFWDTPQTPRATRLPPRYRGARETEAGEAVEEFSPLRLLQRDQGDTHGLDRRSRRRDLSHGTFQRTDPEHGSARLLSAVHRPAHAVLGLSTAHGWALVRTLSLAPTGVLLHLLDVLSTKTRPEHRREGQAVLRRLAPLLGAPLRPGAVHEPGSLLATVGGCLLAPRVVADLSNWASQPVARRGASQGGPNTLTVTLMLPAGDPSSTWTDAQGIVRLEGELVPMTDPQPQVLAVALSPRALAQLELAVRRRTRP